MRGFPRVSAAGGGRAVGYVRHAALKEDDFVRERDVILEEIKMYRDLPQHVVQENLQAVLYKDHALGRPISGSPETLMAFDRSALLRYKERAYVPSSTIFAFAGRLDHGACVACVEKTVGALRPRRGLSFGSVDGSVDRTG
jgi:predicted Zn-dependent peptidase